MSTQPVLFPVLLATETDPLVRGVAAYLARFNDATRVHTESDLWAFVAWCTERGLPTLSARRVHIELPREVDAGSAPVQTLHGVAADVGGGWLLPDLRD
jgi:hypothetical protein